MKPYDADWNAQLKEMMATLHFTRIQDDSARIGGIRVNISPGMTSFERTDMPAIIRGRPSRRTIHQALKNLKRDAKVELVKERLHADKMDVAVEAYETHTHATPMGPTSIPGGLSKGLIKI